MAIESWSALQSARQSAKPRGRQGVPRRRGPIEGSREPRRTRSGEALPGETEPQLAVQPVPRALQLSAARLWPVRPATPPETRSTRVQPCRILESPATLAIGARCQQNRAPAPPEVLTSLLRNLQTHVR